MLSEPVLVIFFQLTLTQLAEQMVMSQVKTGTTEATPATSADSSLWKTPLDQLLINQEKQTQLLQSIQLRFSQSESGTAGKLAAIQQELRELEWGGGLEGAVDALRADLNNLRQMWEYRQAAETNKQEDRLPEIENKVNQISLMLRRVSNQVQDLGRTINANIKSVIYNTSIMASKVNTERKEKQASSPNCRPSATSLPQVNTSTHLPMDCWDILGQGHNRSGVYQIQPSVYYPPFMVVCDMHTLGGGWTVFQSRQDGSTHFTRPWRDFETGFGNMAAYEFWLGLDKLHQITNSRVSDLLVTLKDHSGDSAWAYYEQFAVGDSDQDYSISSLGNYHGTAGDSLREHVYKFSAEDRDNDLNNGVSCARSGAWWYQDCEDQETPLSNLNGLYLNGSLPQVFPAQGMLWTSWRGLSYSIPQSAMMVRPSADVYMHPIQSTKTPLTDS